MASQMVRRTAAVAIFALFGCSAEGSSDATSPVVSATESTTDFALSSPAMVDGGELPIEFTCDGSSTSPPLAWSGAPDGTAGYAIAMHHVPGPGDTHWYWVLYGIDATVDHVDAGAVLLAAIDGSVLAEAQLDVTYERP